MHVTCFVTDPIPGDLARPGSAVYLNDMVTSKVLDTVGNSGYIKPLPTKSDNHDIDKAANGNERIGSEVDRDENTETTVHRINGKAVNGLVGAGNSHGVEQTNEIHAEMDDGNDESEEVGMDSGKSDGIVEETKCQNGIHIYGHFEDIHEAERNINVIDRVAAELKQESEKRVRSKEVNGVNEKTEVSEAKDGVNNARKKKLNQIVEGKGDQMSDKRDNVVNGNVDHSMLDQRSNVVECKNFTSKCDTNVENHGEKGWKTKTSSVSVTEKGDAGTVDDLDTSSSSIHTTVQDKVVQIVIPQDRYKSNDQLVNVLMKRHKGKNVSTISKSIEPVDLTLIYKKSIGFKRSSNPTSGKQDRLESLRMFRENWPDSKPVLDTRIPVATDDDAEQSQQFKRNISQILDHLGEQTSLVNNMFLRDNELLPTYFEAETNDNAQELLLKDLEGETNKVAGIENDKPKRGRGAVEDVLKTDIKVVNMAKTPSINAQAKLLETTEVSVVSKSGTNKMSESKTFKLDIGSGESEALNNRIKENGRKNDAGMRKKSGYRGKFAIAHILQDQVLEEFNSEKVGQNDEHPDREQPHCKEVEYSEQNCVDFDSERKEHEYKCYVEGAEIERLKEQFDDINIQEMQNETVENVASTVETTDEMTSDTSEESVTESDSSVDSADESEVESDDDELTASTETEVVECTKLKQKAAVSSVPLGKNNSASEHFLKFGYINERKLKRTNSQQNNKCSGQSREKEDIRKVDGKSRSDCNNGMTDWYRNYATWYNSVCQFPQPYFNGQPPSPWAFSAMSQPIPSPYYPQQYCYSKAPPLSYPGFQGNYMSSYEGQKNMDVYRLQEQYIKEMCKQSENTEKKKSSKKKKSRTSEQC